jgi:hypothetical protein
MRITPSPRNCRNAQSPDLFHFPVGNFLTSSVIIVSPVSGNRLRAHTKKRSASKLTERVCLQAQELLDQGLPVPEVGRQLGILSNTLHKAIRAGRLRPGKKKIHPTRR